jgi:hypothetical protein
MSDVNSANDKIVRAHKSLPATAMNSAGEDRRHQVGRSLRASVSAMPALGDACIVVTHGSLLRWLLIRSASANNEAQVLRGVVITRTS